MPKRIGEPGKGFVLGQTLGSGSFGEIKLARDEATGDAVAVKICSKHLVSKGKMRPMLQREIANMKSLSHPNVLKLICVLESTKQFYLAIELATGGELFDLIADKTRFSEETARSYFQQLLLGIDYCHKRGIVHRDLKPQNLLVTHENVLKIADFGFSNFQGYTEDGKVTPALRLRTCCGTPSYAAPEIFLGKGYNGFLTDVWSCGIILYVMLIGTVPFKPRGPDQGLQGVITAIMKGVFVLPKALSEDAKDLIRKILIVDPRRRAAIDGIFAHPWFAVDFDPASRSAAASETVSEDDVRRSIMPTNDEEEANSLAATLSSTMQAPTVRTRKSLPLSPPTSPLVATPHDLSDDVLAVIDEEKRTGSSSVFDDLGHKVVPRDSLFSAAGNADEARTEHQFCKTAFPGTCFYCGKTIYGSGMRCSKCKCPVHVKCVASASEYTWCEQYLNKI